MGRRRDRWRTDTASAGRAGVRVDALAEETTFRDEPLAEAPRWVSTRPETRCGARREGGRAWLRFDRPSSAPWPGGGPRRGRAARRSVMAVGATMTGKGLRGTAVGMCTAPGATHDESSAPSPTAGPARLSEGRRRPHERVAEGGAGAGTPARVMSRRSLRACSGGIGVGVAWRTTPQAAAGVLDGALRPRAERPAARRSGAEPEMPGGRARARRGAGRVAQVAPRGVRLLARRGSDREAGAAGENPRVARHG